METTQKKKFSYYLIALIIAMLLLGTALVLAWAAQDKDNSGTQITSSSSVSSMSEEGACGDDIPAGWQTFVDEPTGVCYALPDQAGYEEVDATLDVAIASKNNPMQWYKGVLDVVPSKRVEAYGLSDAVSLPSLFLVNSPDRISLTSFACGGLCADQSLITIHKDEGNAGDLNSLILKLEADQGEAENAVGGGISYVNVSQNFLDKWGYDVVYFLIQETSLVAERTFSYYLISTGSSAYSITHEGSNSVEIAQILNSLVIPGD